MPCTRSKISQGKNLTLPKYKVRGTNLITVVRSAWNHNIFRIPSLLPQPHCYSLTGFQSHFWSQEQKMVCRIPAQGSADNGAALTWAWPVHVFLGSCSHRHPCISRCATNPAHSSTNALCPALKWLSKSVLENVNTRSQSVFKPKPQYSEKASPAHRDTPLPVLHQKPQCTPHCWPVSNLLILLSEETFQNNFQDVNHFPGILLRFSSQKHELLIS